MTKLCLSPVALAMTYLFLLINHNIRCQTILAPSKLYAGESNKLLLISDSDSVAQLKTSYDKNSVANQPSQLINFKKGQLVEWDLVLGNNLENRNILFLSVVFDNGREFVEQFKIVHTSGFILLQSDKPIYRVTEQVKFRAIRIDRTLMPIKEKLLLRIKNNQALVVDEAQLETRPPTFIAEYSFNFPLIAKPGIWSAELLYGPNLTSAHSISLEITEYVPPLFRIDVTIFPKFIFNTNNTEISTNVTYTYGKPVNGTIYYRFGYKEHSKYTAIASSDTYCLKNGLHNFTYDITPIKAINVKQTVPLQLWVEAVVSDHTTGTKDRATNDRTYLVTSPYVISLQNTILVYKPTVAHSITFEVTNPNNEPAGNVSLNLTLSTDTGDNIVPYIVSSSKQNRKTDKSGKVVFTFTPLKNIGNLNALVQTDDKRYGKLYQANASFMIKPYNSEEEDAFISISNKNEFSYSAGARFHSWIDCNGSVNLDELYLIVISKGIFIYSTKLSSANFIDSSPFIDFELTNRMVPSIRILVISVLQSKKIISDSFRIYVRQAECGVDVSLSTNHRLVSPGSNVTLMLKGNRNDVVGIHAIDEAVYNLRNQKFLTRSNKYKQVLTESDLGCGPGDGIDSLDIIHNAGLKIISTNLPNKVNNIDSGSCKTRSRQKRTVSPLSVDLFQRSCCLLAYLKYSDRKTSCRLRAEIVKKYTNNTNCIVEYLRCCKLSNQNPNPLVVGAAASGGFGQTNGDVGQESQFIYYKIEDELMMKNTFFRSDFRDTWLFNVVLLNDSIQPYTVPIPHSITSWFISTISITPKHGLCLNDEQRITTYKEFSIKVSLPLVIIQHEHTEVVVTIFNYFDTPLSALDVIFKGDKNICTESGTPGIRFRKNIPYISPRSAHTVTFPFVPLTVGVFDIDITAIATTNYNITKNYNIDKVVTKLTVLPPGTNEDKFDNRLSFDLDPTNIVKRETKISTPHILDETLPEIQYQRTQIKLKIHDELANVKNGSSSSDYFNIVPNTTRYVITALGERFSPKIMSIEDLAELIKKPKGCGEQNMYYMAFNLYTMMYLEAIHKLNSTTRDLGIKYLKQALRQQLSFRRNDGSFSAFEGRPSGSVWLTGFVSKVICQSIPFLNNKFDAKIIAGSLKWLLDSQAKDGSFTESYPVLHEKALGGVSGKMALTAYLQIALNECHQNVADSKIDLSGIDLTETIKKTEKYLKKYINSLNDSFGSDIDSYSLALTAYALSFNQQAIAENININAKLRETLQLRASRDSVNNLRYWESNWSPVETTSYALMTLLNHDEKNVIDHISISNWLSSIMQIDGTFHNTQNTVVALEALSRYYWLYNKNENDNESIKLYSNVSFNSKFKRSIEFGNHNNSNIPQTIAVDPGTRKIDFESRGNGLGKVNVLIHYNLFKPNGTCQFDLDVNISELKKIGYNSGTVDETEKEKFNDQNFFSSILDLKRELRVVEPNHSPELLDCIEPKYSKSKRSSGNDHFWNNLISRFTRPLHNNQSGITSAKPNRNRNKLLDENSQLDLPPLPNLGINNPVIRLLNICVRPQIRDQSSSDMTLLEVRMLSGYQPVDADLQYIQNRNKSYVEAYENINSKVSFYFRAIPFARRYCIKFRIYQLHKVQHVQSALVRIYSYYSKDWGCSRLYSDVRIPKSLQYQCRNNSNNNYCRCVINSKCPSNQLFEAVLKKSSNNFQQAYKEFVKLVCSYSNVLLGVVSKKGYTLDDHNSPVYQIKPKLPILGEKQTLNVMLNHECSYNYNKIGINSTVVLMHNQQFPDDQIIVLGGNSIFFHVNQDDHHKSSSSLFKYYERDNLDSKCRPIQ